MNTDCTFNTTPAHSPLCIGKFFNWPIITSDSAVYLLFQLVYLIKYYLFYFRYGATFIDLPVARFSPGKMIHETQVVDAMRGLLENLKQQARTNLSIEDLKESEPDLK